MNDYTTPGPHRQPRREPRRYITSQAEFYATEALRHRDATIMLTLINLTILAITVAIHING